MLVWLVRVVAVLWLAGVLVVAVGTYAPRLPVIGFLGSFVTGQYPLHATLAAVLGVGLGGLAWALGAGRTGPVTGALALVAVVAGATLALSTAAGVLAGDLDAPRPRAVVAYYPVTDLRRVAPSLQDAVLGGPAADLDAAVRAGSPTDLVRPDLPPTLLVLGSADHFVFPDLVHAYDRALRAAGVPGRLLEVPHADHVFDHPFGSPGAQATRPAVAAFLAEHVGVAAR